MKVAENNLSWSKLCSWTLFLKPMVLHGAVEGACKRWAEPPGRWIPSSALGRRFCLL